MYVKRKRFMPTVYSSFGFAFDTNVYSSDTRGHWHDQRMLQFLFDTNCLFSLFISFFSFVLIILMPIILLPISICSKTLFTE